MWSQRKNVVVLDKEYYGGLWTGLGMKLYKNYPMPREGAGGCQPLVWETCEIEGEGVSWKHDEKILKHIDKI